MGKKKGKRVDPEKKAALAAKKEAKAEKSTRKRLNKEARAVVVAGVGAAAADQGGGASDDDDENENLDDNSNVNVDRLLHLYKQRDASRAATKTCQVIPCEQQGPPLLAPRANATLTITTDTKKKEAYLFGGEYFDGAANIVSDQLFKYDLQSKSWKQIVAGSTSCCPPPRCAHSTVYYNRCLYVFGGELATTSEYHHYKDVWKFDTVKLEWSEIKPSKNTGTVPSARSGHAVVVWKHFMIVFGGFYEGSRGDQAPRWYNDVTVLDLQTETWLDIPHSKLSSRPEPRSACNAALVGDDDDNNDQWLIHGGFSKLATRAKQQQQQQQSETPGLPVSETKVHTDAWILHLKPLLSGKPPTWERWTTSLSKSKQAEAVTFTANGRSGVGSVSYNKNMLLFGGVVDIELHHHKVDSVFYNDLSIFHAEKRKFIPIRISDSPNSASKSMTTSRSRKAKSNDNDDVSSEGKATNDDDDDEDDAILKEEDDREEKKTSGWDLDKLRSNVFAFIDGDGNTVYENIVVKEETEGKTTIDQGKATSSSMSKREQELTPDIIIERTEPLPRIKSCLFMNGNTLYVYGGLLEVGDREVTLDDMWCIDLRKKRYWECIFPGTMHKQVWRGAVHDDDDSYFSNTADKADDDLEGELTESEDGEENDNEATPSEKIERRSTGSIKKEMSELVDRYELEDANRTPQPDETLAEFYARTSEYWNQKAAAQKEISSGETDFEALSGKNLKREGFNLARVRFEELEPIIKRLLDLKKKRKEQKAEKKESKSKSKKSSSNR